MREAGEAAGELIAGRVVTGYDKRPILAQGVTEKARRSSSGQVLRAGNHDGSSKTMEHAILVQIMTVVSAVVVQHGLKLDIVIDGDLDCRRLLRKYDCVNKIALDLSHKLKNFKKFLEGLQAGHPAKTFVKELSSMACGYIMAANDEGKTDKQLMDALHHALVDHLSDDHNNCWDSQCISKQIPSWEMSTPNLKNRPRDAQLTRAAVQKYFSDTSVSLISYMRTSHNEAFHHEKLVLVPKHLDQWASYRARIAIAVIKHNDGPAAVRDAMAKAFGYSAENLARVQQEQLWQERGELVVANRETIVSRNVQRRSVQETLRHEYVPFDVNVYGQRAHQDRVQPSPSPPSTSTLAVDLEAICRGCGSYVHTTRGLCSLCEGYEDLMLGLFPSLGGS